jgi:Flp pilus assembly protein TadD
MEELLSAGLTAFIQDNYQTALSYFSKALEKDAENEKALLYRASTYNKIGEYDLALKDLHLVKTEYFELLYQRALAHFHNEKVEEAKKDLQKAKELKSLTNEELKRLNNLLIRLDK